MAGSRVFSLLHTQRPADVIPAAHLLMLHIANRHSTEKHCAWVARAEIARLLNVTERSAREMVSELERQGYLRVYERARYWSRYVLMPLPGEVLPGDIVIPDGPILHDVELNKDWLLREPREKGDTHEDYKRRAEYKRREREAVQFAADLARNSAKKKGQGRR